jgi:hypothetical protein
MRGGAFNTASFYGDVENAYRAENEGTDIMRIDYQNNLARPALGLSNMTGGGNVGGYEGGGCGCNKTGGCGKGCGCSKGGNSCGSLANSRGGNSCGLKSSMVNGGAGRRTAKRPARLFSCKKLNVIIMRKLKEVFRHFGVTVNKSSFKILVTKFNTILTELISKFHKVSGDITLSKAKAVFKNYKIMKNDI